MTEEVYKHKLCLAIKDNFELLVKKLASEQFVLKIQDRLMPITEKRINEILAEEIQAFHDFLQEQDENIPTNRGKAVCALGYDWKLVMIFLSDLDSVIRELDQARACESFSFTGPALFNYRLTYLSAYSEAENIKQFNVRERLLKFGRLSNLNN